MRKLKVVVYERVKFMKKILSVATCIAMEREAKRREKSYSEWLSEAKDTYKNTKGKDKIKAFLVVVLFALGKSVARIERLSYKRRVVDRVSKK